MAFKGRKKLDSHHSLAATLHARQKIESNILKALEERKCEPRILKPPKLTFTYKEYKYARTQGILLPWKLSEKSTRGWASDNQHE